MRRNNRIRSVRQNNSTRFDSRPTEGNTRISNFEKRLGWIVALVTILGTFISNYIAYKSMEVTRNALTDSQHQNKVSDDRYIKNERENKLATKLADERANTQIKTLLDENKLQRDEAIRNRKNDSIIQRNYNRQLALLNTEITYRNQEVAIQNKSFNNQRRSNQSYLLLSTAFLPDKYTHVITKQYPPPIDLIRITPIFSVTNISNTVAENVVIDLLFIEFDNWNKSLSCIRRTSGDTKGIFLKPNEYKNISEPFTFTGRTDLDIERNSIKNYAYNSLGKSPLLAYDALPIMVGVDENAKKKLNDVSKKYQISMDSLQRKYPSEFYKYYIVFRLSYKDKYESELRDIYGISKVGYKSPNFNLGEGIAKEFDRNIRSIPVDISELEILKKCIVGNKFDYSRLYKIAENNNISY